MNYNFEITKMLYSFKHINDLYYKLSTMSAEQCGISKPEADVLIFLYNNPTCDTAKDIVKLKGFSKAYVSKAVEPLLAKNLITMEIDKNDRRCQHLKITDNANVIIENLRKMQLDFINQITSGITTEDLNTYSDVVEKFSENSLKFNNLT